MRSQWPMKAEDGFVPTCASRIGVVNKTRILHSMMLGLEIRPSFGGLFRPKIEDKQVPNF